MNFYTIFLKKANNRKHLGQICSKVYGQLPKIQRILKNLNFVHYMRDKARSKNFNKILFNRGNNYIYKKKDTV